MAAWIPSFLIICSMSKAASGASREWAAVPGAVIEGENDELKHDFTLDQCKTACTAAGWCKSIEHTDRYGGKCQLSRKTASEVGELKTGNFKHYPANSMQHITYYEPLDGTCQTMHIPKAALEGHNRQTLSGHQTVASCTQECLAKPWCKSFDWHGNSGSCWLSDKKASDVGGLKNNSDGTCDYYELAPCQTMHIPKAALEGHNRQTLSGHQTVASCTQECLAKPWCKSFDWHGNSGSCWLSDKKASDVGGLKHNSDGTCDYYELAPRTQPAPAPARLYEGHQAIPLPPVTQSFFVGACVGSLSLAGIAMGVIAIRRACKHAGQNGHGLLERDDEHIQLEEQ
eukprot:CAMPEP_0172778760 /NCGR_PEP_ID=MMETSP1074-20121228/202076_1 /TAXON_ID=2916 /ORGANISM="Ceratium fusus, Strain PA161109" /LENGTH=341 /DNA_ID=CAMNT_0013615709 /DNA_START=68 /DNA_END=1093 /DNA_ORIENTATION=-